MRSPVRLDIDVVVAGVAVADVIGRPVDIGHLPRRGGLQLLDSMTLTTGGNVSNSGIDLAKMGFRVAAISRIGDDTLGEFILNQYERFGVRTEGVVVDPRRQTSATFVAVDPHGERTFLHTRGCLANFRAEDVLRSLPVIRRARIFAFGYLGLLKEVDYFIPSHDEAMVLSGERRPEAIVRQFRRWGAQGVVGVKLGAEGCFISTPDRETYVRAVKVRRVVDATGAGDAFVAGFQR